MMNLLNRNQFYDYDVPEDVDLQFQSLQRPLSATQHKFIQENELYEAFGSRRESEDPPQRDKLFTLQMQFPEPSPLIRNQEQKVRRMANIARKMNSMFNYRSMRKMKLQTNVEVSFEIQQCFSIFAQAIADSTNLKFLFNMYLNFSGNDLPPILLYELSYGLRRNKSLIEIDLGSCGLTSASLANFLRRISNHQSLRSINLYNNQNAVNSKDIKKFIIEGDNLIRNIKLTHCNMSGNNIARFLRSITRSKEINTIDISMMFLNTQALEGLGYGLQMFRKKIFGQQRTLELLNLSYTQLVGKSIGTLISAIGNNVSIREINLRHNRVTNIEKFLDLVKDLRKLDLSDNDLKEFTYNETLYQLILANNEINTFPEQNYLSHILSLNLESNKITQSGAFQLSALLRQIPNPSWVELILSNNPLTTEGFNSIIFGLRDNYTLKKLVVANCRIDGQGIICLMINHEQLSIEHLDFSANPIRYSILFVLLNFLRTGPLRLLRAQRILSDNLINVVKTEQTTISSSGNKSPYRSNSPIRLPLDFTTASKRLNRDNLTFKRWSSSYQQQDNNIQNSKNHNQPIPVFQINAFNLREIDFSGNKGILQSVCASLSAYYNRIESLNLTGCDIPCHQDLKNLAYFIKRSSNLLELSLGSIGIGLANKTAVKQFFISLGLNQTIRRLNLSIFLIAVDLKVKGDNQLGTYFHALVKHGLKSYNLEELNLRKNCIKNTHAQDLQRMLQHLRNIRELNLEENQLGYSCILALAKGIRQAIFLKSLNLGSQSQFTCDDLLALSHLIQQADGLQKLNISQNPGFNRIGSEYISLRQNQKQVIFKQMLFDRDNFANLLETLKVGKKHINSLIIDSCILQREQVQFLLPILTTLKNLKHFGLNHYPQIDHELMTITDLKKLKILQLNYIILGKELMRELKDLFISRDCKIECLDLSHNYFSESQLCELQEGISHNKSIKSLILRECDLSANDLTQLGSALNKNQSIKTLDLSFNQIDESCGLFEYFQGSRVNQLINFIFSGNLDEIDFISLFAEQEKDEFIKKNINLSCVDLSRTRCSMMMFENILTGMKTVEYQYGFNYIKTLILSSNRISDDYALIISDMLEYNQVIQVLDLSNNNISSDGASSIFEGMLKHQSIRNLNIENNKITDTFLLDVQILTKNLVLQKFQFLLMDMNCFTYLGLKAIIEVMKNQDRLFVDYSWKSLDDQAGILILNKYIQIGKLYHLDDKSMPAFLRTIKFSNCKLTDHFCKYLAENLAYLFYVENIDISLNERITMHGKAYLFIHLFDPKYEDQALKSFKISDNNTSRNLFDNGIIKYLLLWLKEKLNADVRKFMNNSFQKQLSLQDDRRNRIILQIMGGRFGSWFNERIESCLSYIEMRDPPDFIISNLFSGKFHERYKKLRIIHSITFITFMLLVGISLSFLSDLFQKSNEEFWQNFDPNDQNLLQSFLSRIFSDEYNRQWNLFFTINLLLTIFEIIISKWIRSVIYVERAPPKLIKQLRSKLPLWSEIAQSFKSFLLRLNIVIDVLIVYSLLRLKNIPVLQNDEYLQNLVDYIQQIYIIVMFLIGVRIIRIVVQNSSNYYKLIRANPKDNQAEYLMLTWKKFYFENYMIIADIIAYFSPNDGINLTKNTKINLIAYIEGLYLTKNIPMIVILLKIQIKFGKNGFDSQYERNYENEKNIFFFAILLEIYRIIDSSYIALTKRPTIIDQRLFDKALITKQTKANQKLFIDYKSINEKDEKAKFKLLEKAINGYDQKGAIKQKINTQINIISASLPEDDEDSSVEENKDLSLEHQKEKKEQNLSKNFKSDSKKKLIKKH